ncbi:MAG: hypothetical protein MJZ74_07320 [Muribaculaceae bacterium]|nr:hypothetical protein [Muribaculaceae bacterium]
MKKLLLTVLVATALVACNEKAQKVTDATETPLPLNTEEAAPKNDTLVTEEAGTNGRGEIAAPQNGENPLPAGVETVDATGDKAVKTNQAANTQEEMKRLAKRQEEVKSKCTYEPTGDMDKDAQVMVDMQLALAQKATDGKASDAENMQVEGALLVLGDYYGQKGQKDEFAKVLSQKMREGVQKLAGVKK